MNSYYFTVLHAEPMGSDNFVVVAVVVLDSDLPVEMLLDEVYELTNNIDGPWTDNSEVMLFADAPVRSTSVGDRIVFGQSVWAVDVVGFNKFQ